MLNSREDVDAAGIEVSFRHPQMPPGRGLEWVVRFGDRSGDVILRTEEMAGEVCRKLQNFLEKPSAQFLDEWRLRIDGGEGFFSRLNGVDLQFKKIPMAATGIVMEGGLQRVEFGFHLNWSHSETGDISGWASGCLGKIIPIWDVILPVAMAQIDVISELDDGESYSEGSQYLAEHLKRERDPRVILVAKQEFARKNGGRLFCEVCGFDFSRRYGARGEGYIEGHHKRPVSQMKLGDVTRAKDIALVCANCHRILHRGPFVTPEMLRTLLCKHNGS